MPAPALYLDECIEHRLATLLRHEGIDVLTVQEAQAHSDDDESQLVYATQAGRVLLSHNQRHFRRLHAAFQREGRPHGGIALIPQTVPLARLETRIRLMLEWLSTFPEHRSKLFTWSDLQQVIIRGYRLPGWSERDIEDALGRS